MVTGKARFHQRRQGDIRTGWAGVSAIRDQNREVQSLIIIMSDITERKASEERIHKLAYYDPLTALPNRSQMHETLDGMLKRARKQGLWVVLFSSTSTASSRSTTLWVILPVTKC